MTHELDQKIGQTLMIGFEGTTLTDELREMIERYHVGGVILFARNIESPSQVAQLTNDMQRAARESGHPGLFVAIDQEGGRVARLTEATGFTEFPSAMAVAATGRADAAEQVGRALAEELRVVGINVDFAPDLDVNNNPANPVIGTRSYGSTPEQVAEFGVAAIKGIQSQGVLAFGKHFPGHGDTDTDSHFALPSVAHGRARLDAVELVPFRAAITANVAGIMSAHVLFPEIEPRTMPATLSSAALVGLLRDKMNFQGLIVTDSLEMGALASNGYGPAQAAAAALAAGADILLFNSGHDDHKAAFALIKQQIESGDLPVARLDAAVERILQAKHRFGIAESSYVDPEQAQHVVGTPERTAFSRALAGEAITLLRDQSGVLPIADIANTCVIETSGVGLGEMLELATIALDGEPTPSQLEAVERAVAEGKTLVVGISAVAQKPGHVALIHKLLAGHARVVLVALRDPYDLLLFPQAPTMLATYATPITLLGPLRDVLAGHAAARGRLPVELPGLFPLGTGMLA